MLHRADTVPTAACDQGLGDRAQFPTKQKTPMHMQTENAPNSTLIPLSPKISCPSDAADLAVARGLDGAADELEGVGGHEGDGGDGDDAPDEAPGPDEG